MEQIQRHSSCRTRLGAASGAVMTIGPIGELLVLASLLLGGSKAPAP